MSYYPNYNHNYTELQINQMFHLREYFPDVSLDAYNVSRGYLAHQVSLEAYELQNIYQYIM